MSYAGAPEEILRRLGIDDPEQIDVDVIAWDLGATVRYVPLRGCDARIVGADDKAYITVDSTQSPERQRFSVAHELGHWLLHRGSLMMCQADDIDGPLSQLKANERDADAFAAALLMPAYLFTCATTNLLKGEPWNEVSALGKKFGVSAPAVALRLITLGLWPGWLVCHGKSGRLWYRASHTIPFSSAPRLDLDPRSPSFELLYGSRSTSRSTKSKADAWFDFSGADRREVVEHSRPYGPAAVITLLRMHA